MLAHWVVIMEALWHPSSWLCESHALLHTYQSRRSYEPQNSDMNSQAATNQNITRILAGTFWSVLRSSKNKHSPGTTAVTGYSQCCCSSDLRPSWTDNVVPHNVTAFTFHVFWGMTPCRLETYLQTRRHTTGFCNITAMITPGLLLLVSNMRHSFKWLRLSGVWG